MFKVIKSDVPCEWPVDVPVPQHGGKVKKHRFTAMFRLVGRAEGGELVGEGRGDDDFLREVWVGWGDDVQDEAGNPIPFSEQAREELLDIHYVRDAVVAAYFDFSRGRARKN